MNEPRTKLHIDDLVCRIVTKPILPPKEMTIDEMMAWAIGYKQSTQEILAIIQEMRGDETC